MDAIERGIEKMKDAGSNIKEKIKEGEDIPSDHDHNDQRRRDNGQHQTSSSSSRTNSPKEGQNQNERKGSIGEQLFGMKKKIIVNHINIKPKVPDNGHEMMLVQKRNGSEQEKEMERVKAEKEELEQKLNEAREKEHVLIKRIDELENELKLMRLQLTMGNDRNRSKSSEVEIRTDSSQTDRRPSGDDNFLSPYRRSSFDGRVSPAPGGQSTDSDNGGRRGSRDGSRDRSKDRGQNQSDQRGRQDDRKQQDQRGRGGNSPGQKKSPCRGNHDGDRKDQKRKESTGGELMFGR